MKRFTIGLVSVLLLAVGAGVMGLDVGTARAQPAASPTAGMTPSFGCLPQADPTITPTLPADSLLTEQPEVNCFAWQEFVALNWQADPALRGQPDTSVGADKFGDPNVGTVTWETYKSTADLFLPRGAQPKAWNTPVEIPSICDASYRSASSRPTKVLHLQSKFHPGLGPQQVLDEINEAGVAPPAWLTAQNGRLVHYEVLVNQEFFDYVVDPENKFYDARQQGAAVQPGGQGIRFPVGPSPYGEIGVIELKAGWLEIDPAHRSRFLTAEALIVTAGATPPCRTALVGLVGLHVAHKTKSMPNWTWATFEQVDNAPNRIEVAKGELMPPYTFFKPDCRPVDAPECQPNRKPQSFDEPMDRPIQVVREVPIPGYVRALNLAMHELIKQANPDSVFRYYRLVNTLWPQSGEELPVGAWTPINQGGPAPTTGLSNVTSETYAQNKTCLKCHQSAPIACSSVAGPNPIQASDFSFQLSRAQEPHPPRFCGGDGD